MDRFVSTVWFHHNLLESVCKVFQLCLYSLCSHQTLSIIL